MQRGDEIVVLFASLVIEQDALLQRVADDVISNFGERPVRSFLLGEGSGYFQDIVGAAGVATGVTGDLSQDVVRCLHFHFAQATLLVE